MKLRTQLLLASALTLLVPLVSYQAIQQLDAALRETRRHELVQQANSAEQLLRFAGLLSQLPSTGGQLRGSVAPGTAASVATELAETNATSTESRGSGGQLPAHDLYAEQVDYRIALDGYPDEWISTDAPKLGLRFNASEGGPDASVRAAVSRNRLYLFLNVADQQLLYHNPNRAVLASGDAVEIVQWLPAVAAAGGQNDTTVNAAAAVDSATMQQQEPVLQRRTFRAIAPGALTSYYQGRWHEGLQPIRRDVRYRGYWEETSSGYQLEVSMPLPPNRSRLGIVVHDRDAALGAVASRWSGSFELTRPGELGRLVYPIERAREVLASVVPAGGRVRLYDQDARLRAEVDRLYEVASQTGVMDPGASSLFNALLFRFFNWLIREQNVAVEAPFTRNGFELERDAEWPPSSTQQRSYTTRWQQNLVGVLQPLTYTAGADDEVQVAAAGNTVMTAASSVGAGFLLFEANEDTVNAFTSSVLVRLFSLVMLVSLLVAMSLLLFASWLSLRIRRLSQATRAAVTHDGRIVGQVSRSQAHDEIGDLTRDFASLVERSSGYTAYLESLASKLSHELRTPLSVVQTSLENLDGNTVSSDNQRLIQRAQDGSQQLSRLIRSMSEAARLEQTVKDAEHESFDVVRWLNNAIAGYRDVYPEQSLQLRVEPVSTSLVVYAVPPLLHQALDKLVSNAVEFSEPGALVTVTVTHQPNSQQLVFSVINHGPPLPPATLPQLFEPLYSVRDQPAPGHPHLGLGLYIVKLIAQAHGGNVFARNLETLGAVEIGFSVALQ